MTLPGDRSSDRARSASPRGSLSVVRRSLLIAVAAAVIAVPAPVGAGDAEPFVSSISRLDRETRELMTGSSWREGCPVGLRLLRLVRVMYVGFDGEAHHGRLVVHRRWSDEIVEV